MLKVDFSQKAWYFAEVDNLKIVVNILFPVLTKFNFDVIF